MTEMKLIITYHRSLSLAQIKFLLWSFLWAETGVLRQSPLFRPGEMVSTHHLTYHGQELNPGTLLTNQNFQLSASQTA